MAVADRVPILSGEETTVMLPLKDLHPFPRHPFKVIHDEQMNALVESVKAVGVLMPILVRPRKRGGGYEIISGHRRTESSKQAGLTHIPAIVKNMDNDRAILAMVDTNLRQRETIRVSERAFAYQMKMDSILRMREQGENDSELSGKTKDIVARMFGVNATEVQRITRLINLIVPMLTLLDQGVLPVTVGYELSFLPTDAQCWIVEYQERGGKLPVLKQAKALRSECDGGTLTQERLIELLALRTSPKRQTIRAPSIQWERIYEYIPGNLQDEDIEDLLCRALERYHHEMRYKA